MYDRAPHLGVAVPATRDEAEQGRGGDGDATRVRARTERRDVVAEGVQTGRSDEGRDRIDGSASRARTLERCSP